MLRFCSTQALKRYDRVIAVEPKHANGDDFVIVDSRNSPSPMSSAMARRMGDRNRGVGFNQLAVLLDCDDADAWVMFWNADGSALDVCGSATRGAADLLMREANVASVALRTNRGLLICERTPNGDICVDMGVPLCGWSDIPLSQELDSTVLPLAGSPAACSMGNPHCTYFVDDLADVDDRYVRQIRHDAVLNRQAVFFGHQRVDVRPQFLNLRYQLGPVELAILAAREAGRIIMRSFRTEQEVTHKSPDQPLTQADLDRSANKVLGVSLDEVAAALK